MQFSIARVAAFWCLALCAASAGAGQSPPSAFRKFAAQYCAECHSADPREGGLDLASFAWQPTEPTNFDRWVKIFDQVEKGEMPPASETRPPRQAQTAALEALGSALRAVNRAAQQQNGRVILRRLNRVEYENTMHGLLGIDTPLREILPEDTPLEGFDTVADGLRLSPLHLEKYLEAADVALDAAICLSRAPERLTKRFPLQGTGRNSQEPAQRARHVPRTARCGGVVLRRLVHHQGAWLELAAHGHVSAARLGMGLSKPAAGGAAHLCRRLSPRDDVDCWATSTCRSTSRTKWKWSFGSTPGNTCILRRTTWNCRPMAKACTKSAARISPARVGAAVDRNRRAAG